MSNSNDTTKPILLTEYDGAEDRELTEEELALLEVEKKYAVLVEVEEAIGKPDPQDAAWDYQP